MWRHWFHRQSIPLPQKESSFDEDRHIFFVSFRYEYKVAKRSRSPCILYPSLRFQLHSRFHQSTTHPKNGNRLSERKFIIAIQPLLYLHGLKGMSVSQLPANDHRLCRCPVVAADRAPGTPDLYFHSSLHWISASDYSRLKKRERDSLFSPNIQQYDWNTSTQQLLPDINRACHWLLSLIEYKE